MDTISHPNQFFELSVKLAGGLDGASVIGKDANGNSDVSAARDTTSTGTTQEIEVAANVDGAVMDVDR